MYNKALNMQLFNNFDDLPVTPYYSETSGRMNDRSFYLHRTNEVARMLGLEVATRGSRVADIKSASAIYSAIEFMNLAVVTECLTKDDILIFIGGRDALAAIQGLFTVPVLGVTYTDPHSTADADSSVGNMIRLFDAVKSLVKVCGDSGQSSQTLGRFDDEGMYCVRQIVVYHDSDYKPYHVFRSKGAGSWIHTKRELCTQDVRSILTYAGMMYAGRVLNPALMGHAFRAPYFEAVSEASRELSKFYARVRSGTIPAEAKARYLDILGDLIANYQDELFSTPRPYKILVRPCCLSTVTTMVVDRFEYGEDFFNTVLYEGKMMTNSKIYPALMWPTDERWPGLDHCYSCFRVRKILEDYVYMAGQEWPAVALTPHGEDSVIDATVKILQDVRGWAFVH